MNDTKPTRQGFIILYGRGDSEWRFFLKVQSYLIVVSKLRTLFVQIQNKWHCELCHSVHSGPRPVSDPIKSCTLPNFHNVWIASQHSEVGQTWTNSFFCAFWIQQQLESGVNEHLISQLERDWQLSLRMCVVVVSVSIKDRVEQLSCSLSAGVAMYGLDSGVHSRTYDKVPMLLKFSLTLDICTEKAYGTWFVCSLESICR